MDVKIFSHSRYAINVMTIWKARWQKNDFTNPVSGQLIVNRDLMREAYELLESLEHEGKVEFVWIPKHRNQIAHAEVNEVLDEVRQDLGAGITI